MDRQEHHEVVIVGGGPAGLVAGLYCKRAALDAVLFEKGLLGGQIAISKEVENYPGVAGGTGLDLAERMIHQVNTFGLEIVPDEVVEVRAGTNIHSVRLASGKEIQSSAVILAAGGMVRKLGIPGEKEYLGSGVSYCATCDGFFFRNKTVIVVGGGDGAADEALHLARLVRKVFLVHRRSSLRASKMLQNRLFSEPNIEIIWDTVLTEIRGEGGTVSAVAYENRKTGDQGIFPTDGIFISIGYLPNTTLVPPEVHTDEQGFVMTDEKCETNVPGIFVAGDLRKKFANQIIIAAADGCLAALGAARYVEEQKGVERFV